MATNGEDGFVIILWPVPSEIEEYWRRFLQEITGSRSEDYAESRRLRGVDAERVWFLPDPPPRGSGGGMAIFYLEAQDPERALAELATSDAPFDRWYRKKLLDLCGFDLSRPLRSSRGELLFTWRAAYYKP